jgi:hypothetical protein
VIRILVALKVWFQHAPDDIMPTLPIMRQRSDLTVDQKNDLKKRLCVAHLMYRDLDRYGDL